MPSRDELLKRMRKKQEERTTRRKDPDQFSPPQIKDHTTKLIYYFRVLPELHEGDKCASGVCEVDNELWYYENGVHWFQKERHECPRVHDGKECQLCQLGFDLMESAPDKDAKSQLARKYLARQGFAVNVYFLDVKTNPEELRGKVKWFNLPITLWRKMDECISSDDAGDELDQKAHGIFYHPYEGGYTFKLIAQKKGDWNDYSESSFLPKSFSPLMVAENNEPDDKAIQEILAKRIVLQSRFAERNNEKLTMLVKKIENICAGVDDAAEEINTDDDAEAVAPIKSPPRSINEERKQPTQSTSKREATPTTQPAKAQASAPVSAPTQEAKTTTATVADDPELQELLGSIRSRKK
jgi:hypothetical protein